MPKGLKLEISNRQSSTGPQGLWVVVQFIEENERYENKSWLCPVSELHQNPTFIIFLGTLFGAQCFDVWRYWKAFRFNAMFKEGNEWFYDDYKAYLELTR